MANNRWIQQGKTRSSMREHVAQQNEHTQATSNFNGHGQMHGGHPTGSQVSMTKPEQNSDGVQPEGADLGGSVTEDYGKVGW